jgi:hypothetical protein
VCLTHTLTRPACPGARVAVRARRVGQTRPRRDELPPELGRSGDGPPHTHQSSHRPFTLHGAAPWPRAGTRTLATPLISPAWRFRASGRHLHHANRYTTDGVADFDRPRPRRQDVMATVGCQHHWQAGSRTSYLHDRSGAFCGRPRSRCITRRRMHATSPPPADLSAGRVVCQATTDGEFTDDPG